METNKDWFKASFSDSNGTGCVEVNMGTPGVVGLRDSKKPDAGTFRFAAPAWRSFLEHVTSS